jgi:hypothetical protein
VLLATRPLELVCIEADRRRKATPLVLDLDELIVSQAIRAQAPKPADILGKRVEVVFEGAAERRVRTLVVAGEGVQRRVADRRFGENARVPTYTLNDNAVRHAKRLIDARRYVLRSRWQDVQPRARDQNAFLKAHSWEEYAAWHLGLTEGATEETKARYAFVYGDFRRVHRMGLIACHYRAAEWRHKEIELAAHELLQYLDRKLA